MRIYAKAVIAFAFLFVIASGCEYEDDYYDHVPPPGKGSLIIDNNSADDINLYLDGERISEIGDYRVRILDLSPGVGRIVLDEEDGDTTFRDDIDILEGRLTILRIWTTINAAEYTVEIDFE
ncbi:MAG: hypothetical protein ACOC6C_00850 [Verrucomicrobiota bacterium]